MPGLFRERMIVVYTTDMLGDEVIDLVAGEIIDQKELAGHLLARAKEQSVSLVGPQGLGKVVVSGVWLGVMGAWSLWILG